MAQRTVRAWCGGAGLASLLVLAIAGAPAALAAGIKLDSREYKLALELAPFGASPPQDAAASFWKDRLKPIIDARLEPGKKARLKLKAEREVRYFDAPGCPLQQADFILRERRGSGDDKRELMLKLRGLDKDRVAATALPGTKKDAKTKLEEDILPNLAAADGLTRKLSKSTKQPVKHTPRTLKDVEELYPTLKANLPASVDHAAALASGEAVREVVFDGVEVKLAAKVEAEFALTLWFTGPSLRFAELSFKVPGDDPAVDTRALGLLNELRSGLGSVVLRSPAMKSEVALPAECSDTS